MADLTESGAEFDSGVLGSRALLPGRPGFWSYSSLKEIEACPRRYALVRATFPDLWAGYGYPAMPSLAALFGDIVHGSLEIIVKRLAAAGCTGPRSTRAVDVLKSLGGYTRVAEQVLNRLLAQLDGNPRLSPDQRRRLATALGDRLTEARSQIQEYLSRAHFPATNSAPDDAATDGPTTGDATTQDQDATVTKRNEASPGTHPEIKLVAGDLRLHGRIDVLAVRDESADIIDYKTGAEDPAHLDQLALYALLWNLDGVANPKGLPVNTLTAAYARHDVTVCAPDESRLRDLETATRERIDAADTSAELNPPEARPSELCLMCPVRGLCDAYWASIAPDYTTLADGDWFDLEGTIGIQNGPRSWWVHDHSGSRHVLLRTTPSTKPFENGARVRILGVKREPDPEEGTPIAVMSANSEVLTLVGE